MRSARVVVLLATAAVLAIGSWAQALINVNFTPIQVVEQSETILKLTLKPGDKATMVKGEIVRVYKPEAKDQQPKGEVTFDISAARDEQIKAITALMNTPGATALLFVGEFVEEGDGGGQQLPEAFLHVSGRWIDLFKGKADNAYEPDSINTHMQATWAGGTDMLDKAIDYILSTPDEPNIPVSGEASWDFHKQFSTLAGKVHAVRAVTLGEGLKQHLFVARDKGDMLFAFDDKQASLVDVTSQLKLTSRSEQFVWGDFNHDGKLDLASFDGKALSVFAQQVDGTFAPGAEIKAAADAVKNGCLSLSLLDDGTGKAAILVATKSWPVLVSGQGDWKAKPVGEGTLPAKAEFGPAAMCLVGDVTGDNLPDVLQLFAKAGLLYKGKAVGEFDKPVERQIAIGAGSPRAWFGDYDGDGRLDVFAIAADEKGWRLWDNVGDGTFVNMIAYAGEAEYIAKPGGVDGMTTDINNDGRQDILITYAAGGPAPQVFFNRGWRSFGHAHRPVDLQESGILDKWEQGTQTATFGDFNGDGGQDLVVVQADGRAWAYFRKVFDDAPALSARVSLKLDGPYAGPLTVTSYVEGRCLGAWNVTAGSQWGLVARPTAGPITVKWQLPGGKAQEKELLLIDKPTRLVIPEK